MFKHHLQHKSCALSLAAAVVMSAWYTIGYLGFLAAQSSQYADSILQYFPQLFITLQFAPCAIIQPDIWCFLLGLLQIFFATLILVWAIARLYERFYRVQQF